ncbi:hypothetical protein [uncultured Shewanella sp.]|uniref:hypothetical protein n=1 Tax=uncultured Shewanella sp. TaxID=173975 RepID=UPI00262DE756|nr:hypothetical protein [uncultured Shewanella sp.]
MSENVSLQHFVSQRCVSLVVCHVFRYDKLYCINKQCFVRHWQVVSIRRPLFEAMVEAMLEAMLEVMLEAMVGNEQRKQIGDKGEA